VKFSIVLSTHQTSFDALAFRGDLSANLSRIASYGYDGVELAVRDASLVNSTEIRKLVSSAGLEVSAVGTGQAWGEDRLSLIDDDWSIRKKAVERLFGHIDLAADLDAVLIIGLVRGVVRGPPSAAVHELLLDGLRTIAAKAAQSGVKIAIEPINRYETSLINTASEGLDILGQLGASNVGLLLDTFHMNIEEPSIEKSIRQCGGKVFHFHAADSNRWYPGAGHLDFPPILRALAEADYDGYISGEFLPYPSPEEAAQRAIESLKAYMTEV
jgi:sugar phosphate isomerase/epimerase